MELHESLGGDGRMRSRERGPLPRDSQCVHEPGIETPSLESDLPCICTNIESVCGGKDRVIFTSPHRKIEFL